MEVAATTRFSLPNVEKSDAQTFHSLTLFRMSELKGKYISQHGNIELILDSIWNQFNFRFQSDLSTFGEAPCDVISKPEIDSISRLSHLGLKVFSVKNWKF